MNVDEILAVKIPDGKYKLAMIFIRNRTSSFSKCETGFTEDQLCDSLCASFEALYELANRTKQDVLNEVCAEFGEVIEIMQNEARTKALDEVLKVVGEMERDLPIYNGELSDEGVAQEEVLENIKSRIERMKGEGK